MMTSLPTRPNDISERSQSPKKIPTRRCTSTPQTLTTTTLRALPRSQRANFKAHKSFSLQKIFGSLSEERRSFLAMHAWPGLIAARGLCMQVGSEFCQAQGLGRCVNQHDLTRDLAQPHLAALYALADSLEIWNHIHPNVGVSICPAIDVVSWLVVTRPKFRSGLVYRAGIVIEYRTLGTNG